MWKYLKYVIILLLFLGALVYAGYYLYRLNKNGSIKPANLTEQPANVTANNSEKSDEILALPPYLTENFWKTATPQELENQLKTITNVNEVRPDNKKSMLHLLAQHGKYPKMVKMLISVGADYNLRDEAINAHKELDNKKALYYAILREDQAYEFSQALLEYDDVNSYLNNRGGTAVMLAAYARKPINLIQLFLEKGADPNIKSLSTSSNSLIAASVPNQIIGESYIDPKIVQLLLDHNADITARDIYGKNAFDYMQENEEFKKTELFKKLSAQFPQ